MSQVQIEWCHRYIRDTYGSVRWLSWRSPLFPVWLWHVLFDGTRACPCERSRRWRGALALLTTEDPADWPWWEQEGR